VARPPGTARWRPPAPSPCPATPWPRPRGSRRSFEEAAPTPESRARSTHLSGRTGTRLETHYNIAGIHETRLRDYARDSIKYRDTPAVIGTNYFEHYCLAFGYAYQERIVRHCVIVCWDEVVYDRSFFVNQGWGGSGNEWITASTWFAGEIYP